MHIIYLAFTKKIKAFVFNMLGIVLCAVLSSDYTLAKDVVTSNQLYAITEAEKLQLSAHPVWLKLLYVEALGEKSSVTSQAFFLDEKGREDNHLELSATIRAYFQEWPEDTNRHPLCRFPGRYYWLSQHINLPGIDSALSSKCTRLNQWGAHKNTESISLILVGGYLGNPASSFGHTLLKLNSSADNPSDNLFSKTINYGATIPPGESILRYLTSGIFGGYKAVFSNQYYAVQDHVYSRTEYRDMWEYELNLSEQQIKLLLFHVWEISGREFDYYFFDENCAYRIAQLVELASDVPLSKSKAPWYLPEVLFHNLAATDIAGTSNLSGEIKFIPSNKRIIFRQLKLLNTSEVKLVDDILKNNYASGEAWESLEKLKLERRIIILDTLLAYHHYLLVSQRDKPDQFTLQLKKKILVSRLQLPVAKKTAPTNEYIESPAIGNKASWLNLSYYRNELDEEGVRVGLAAFKRDHMSRNSLEGNELVLLDASLTLVAGNVRIDEWNLLKVSNLKPEEFSLAQERSWAWQFALGGRRNILKDESEVFFEAGIGDSIAINDRLFAYGLVGPYAYSVDDYLSLGGKVGLVYLGQTFRLSTFVENAWDKDGDQRKNTYLEIGAEINKSSSLFLDISNREEWDIKMGVSIYF